MDDAFLYSHLACAVVRPPLSSSKREMQLLLNAMCFGVFAAVVVDGGRPEAKVAGPFSTPDVVGIGRQSASFSLQRAFGAIEGCCYSLVFGSDCLEQYALSKG